MVDADMKQKIDDEVYKLLEDNDFSKNIADKIEKQIKNIIGLFKKYILYLK